MLTRVPVGTPFHDGEDRNALRLSVPQDGACV